MQKYKMVSGKKVISTEKTENAFLWLLNSPPH
jgi:hypothetical protein